MKVKKYSLSLEEAKDLTTISVISMKNMKDSYFDNYEHKENHFVEKRLTDISCQILEKKFLKK